jgi:hypothetical protein
MAKNIRFFIAVFNIIDSRETRSLYVTLVELCKHGFVMQPLKIHRYVAAPFSSGRQENNSKLYGSSLYHLRAR